MIFQIYLYQKGPQGEFLRLYFQRSEPDVPDEEKDRMIRISNTVFEEWDKDKPFKTFIDRFTQDET